MSDKRKSRNKMAKDADLLKPLNIDLVGTENDPCFGKLYSPKANECQRCGDSEICAIAMGQINNMKRKLEETKNAFKDVEEANIKPENKKKLRKQIKNRVRELVKAYNGDEVKVSIVVEDIYASYGIEGFMKEDIKQIIKRCAKKSNRLILTKNKLSWKSQS